MGKQAFKFWCFVTVVYCKLLLSSHAIESPSYTVVHSESDFDIRLYGETSFMSAPVQGTDSFEKTTKDGFHRLYRYMHGANLNSSRLPITAPVLTNITPSPHGSMSLVRYYLPAKYEEMPPKPSPDLNLHIDKFKSQCIAVRKFSGFARDDNINEEFQALLNSLEKNVTGNRAGPANKSSYTIAQYDAPFRTSKRLNEVWIDVSGYGAEGCPQNRRR